MNTRTLRFDKQGHCYLVCYQPGMEDEVVERVMRMADDETLNFDWMDAAAMSFHVTELAARDRLGPVLPDHLATE